MSTGKSSPTDEQLMESVTAILQETQICKDNVSKLLAEDKEFDRAMQERSAQQPTAAKLPPTPIATAFDVTNLPIKAMNPNTNWMGT